MGRAIRFFLKRRGLRSLSPGPAPWRREAPLLRSCGGGERGVGCRRGGGAERLPEKRMITIDVWSDFSCPHCVIGLARLWKLLGELGEEEVRPVMHAFELLPDAPKNPEGTAADGFARKCYLSHDDAVACMDRLSKVGREEGLPGMDWAGAIPANTRDAHRLFRWAAAHGVSCMHGRLMRAYFCSHLNLSSHEVLAGLAEKAGLNRDEALAMLSSDAYLKEVLDDEREACDLGIHSVPTFLVNREARFLGSDHFPEMKAWILAHRKNG